MYDIYFHIISIYKKIVYLIHLFYSYKLNKLSMKISNTRVNSSRQPISQYDQSRIDAATQKSDSRVVSRALADKAREESIKATAEYHKSLVDAEKSQMDLEKANIYKTNIDFEKMKLENEKTQIEHNQTLALNEFKRLNNEQAHINIKTIALTHDTNLLDKERLVLNKEVAQLNVEKVRLFVEQSQLDVEQSKYNAIKERAQADVELSRFATNKVLALANMAKDNATIICSQLELERLTIEKSRLDLEKARENNAPANAAKAQAIAANAQSIANKAQSDALILVQRSKIMKTLQLISVQSCKRVDALYFNKSVISITNVYQQTYNNNKYATGFGDFIRGCYFVLDFCEMFHFQPNIVINHPLNEFLETHTITNNSGVLKMITMFEDNNWSKHILNRNNIVINTVRKNDTMTKFVNYLCKLPIDNNNINIYNIVFPYFEVSTEHQKVMCDILKPSQEMEEYVVSTLVKFELTKHNYIIIHIRSGDNFLNCIDKQFELTYLNHIKNDIIKLLNNHPNKCFLLIADNKFIKLYLSSKQIPRLYIMFNEIGHLGENTQLERNQVKNTMLDFYLFAYSSMIYAFSSYDHGTGFSFWCAKTYGIPYSCKIIKQ